MFQSDLSNVELCVWEHSENAHHEWKFWEMIELNHYYCCVCVCVCVCVWVGVWTLQEGTLWEKTREVSTSTYVLENFDRVQQERKTEKAFNLITMFNGLNMNNNYWI